MIKVPAHLDTSLILRGFFASAVVWWHTGGYRLDMPVFDAFNISGRLAVWMFFGLSGYVIGYGFFNQRHRLTWTGISGYLVKRSFRILPLFWLATLVAIALLWFTGNPTVPTLRQLLAIQWHHYDYPVGVFWTLGVELQFYIFAPLVAWLMVTSGRGGLVVGLALWLALWLSLGDTPDNRTMLGNLQHFLTGMLVARANLSGYFDGLIRRWHVAALAILGIFSIGIANLLYHNQEFWTLRAAFVSDVAIASLLIAHCAIERRSILPGPLARTLMVLGILAYGLYAWHGVLLIIWPGLGESFALTYLISAMAAAASYLAIENPIMRIGNRTADRVSKITDHTRTNAT